MATSSGKEEKDRSFDGLSSFLASLSTEERREFNAMQQVYVRPDSRRCERPDFSSRVGSGDGIVNAQTRKRKRKRNRQGEAGGETKEVATKGSLYISSYMPTRWPPLLVRKGITHVISVMSHESVFPVFSEDIVSKRVETDDTEGEDILKHFDDCYAFISRALDKGGVVLVHCVAGRSRSGSIICAFLMRELRCSAARALEIVRIVLPSRLLPSPLLSHRHDPIHQARAARRFVQPNPAFLKQLGEYEGVLEARGHYTLPPGRCELCDAFRPGGRRTAWLRDRAGERFAVLECDQCDDPMAVFRRHTMELSLSERLSMRAALRAEARQVGGVESVGGSGNGAANVSFEIDTKQRSILDHAHWHARSGTSAVRARLWRKFGKGRESGAGGGFGGETSEDEELWGPGGAAAADAAADGGSARL